MQPNIRRLFWNLTENLLVAHVGYGVVVSDDEDNPSLYQLPEEPPERGARVGVEMIRRLVKHHKA